MFIRLFPLVLAILIAGCDMSEKSHEQEGVQRQLIQGMHAEFFKVTDGKTSWFEVSISVDSSKTFRMPVFSLRMGSSSKLLIHRLNQFLTAGSKSAQKILLHSARLMSRVA